VDKQFRYHEKHVHDLAIEDSLVRVWDAEGAINRTMIQSAFRPLLKTGFVWPYVALMPDYHPGEGSMIGSVIPTRDILLPSVIGGDLGCGMTAVALPCPAERIAPDFSRLAKMFREKVPVGTAHNAQVTPRVSGNPIWQRDVRAPILSNRLRRKLLHQFGSLGGGNHFLEVQQDQDSRAWVMLHSGSRYLGVTVRDHYVDRGQHLDGIDSKLYAKIPYLSGAAELAQDYLADIQFVLDFARASRKEMLVRVLECFAEVVPEHGSEIWLDLADTAHDLAHNFIAVENHFGQPLFVHRKGAIQLGQGQIGLIPGSMGTASYVVEGRGNSFGLCSGSHGAGRAMSRADAFRVISDDEFYRSMEGVVHEHDTRIKDEGPAAYKDIRQVMRAQKDLVKVLYELRPLLSVKGC
jgi:tRNA-splicing ligase RtcB